MLKRLLIVFLAIYSMGSFAIEKSAVSTVTFHLMIPQQAFLHNTPVSVVISKAAIKLDTLIMSNRQQVQQQQSTLLSRLQYADLQQAVTIATDFLNIGDHYTVSVMGLSPDNCNNASANLRGVVSNTNIQVNFVDVPFAVTQMACPSGE